MKAYEIKKVIEIKDGKKWIISRTVTDPETVYTSLAHDLIAKKINACLYIKTIRRIPNYNGSQNIIITYDNNVRATYTVAN